jgi:hypothetical protein
MLLIRESVRVRLQIVAESVEFVFEQCLLILVILSVLAQQGAQSVVVRECGLSLSFCLQNMTEARSQFNFSIIVKEYLRAGDI